MESSISSRSLKFLEWERIKFFLVQECTCKASKSLANLLLPMDDYELIENALDETVEFLDLFSNQNHDLRQFELAKLDFLERGLSRLKAGAVLSCEELLQIKQMLAISGKLQVFIKSINKDKYLKTFLYAAKLFPLQDVQNEINKVLDEFGTIREDASSELFQLKKKFRKLNEKVKDELTKIIFSPTLSKALQEPIYTIRNGRHVLPVNSSLRNVIPGIVHDSSSSGLTVYVEPISVIELTNQIKICEAEIDHEIERLLSKLSYKLASSYDLLISTHEALIQIDFIAAKASLAAKYFGIKPKLVKNKEIKIYSCRHPLLVLQNNTCENVISNDIILENKLKCLMITGSNAGGKTVYLKSVGLSILMLRSGLLISAQDNSSTDLFHVFADIGDEQSLEQNLSTFSSHMKNIVEIVKQIKDSRDGTKDVNCNFIDSKDSHTVKNDNILVLLDEIGAGTDPKEGAALAKVILSEFIRNDVLVMCSTHYSDLKSLAHTNPKFSNASVEFDESTLTPTFKMLLGITGSSHALAIASRFGLDAELIDEAEQILLSQKDNFERRVEELEEKIKEINQTENNIASRFIELEKQETELLEKKLSFERESQKLYSNSCDKLENELRIAQKIISDIVSSLQKQPNLAKAAEAKKQLDKIKNELNWTEEKATNSSSKTFQPVSGQSVNVLTLRQKGYFEKICADGLRAEIRIANKRVKVALTDLEFVKSDQSKSSSNSKQKKNKAITNRQEAEFLVARQSRQDVLFVRGEKNTLDLRGLRVEDAKRKVEFFLDESYLKQISPLMIIHGHGTGVIKAIVREMLQNCPYKNNFRPGDTYEGGDGVTIVQFI